MKMRREAAGRITRAVKTAQSGWRSPAISSRNSNTSNAYKKRFPPEYNIEQVLKQVSQKTTLLPQWTVQ